MEYTKFLRTARGLRASQTEYEYKYMELLVDQEADLINWLSPRSPYRSWYDLLRGEGLCTVTTYKNYKRARQHITPLWIEKLGVYPAINIAKLDTDDRDTVLKKVQAWYREYKVRPHYQLVSTFVQGLSRAARKKKSEGKLAKMRAYIKVCQALLKKNKITVPVETWK